MTKLKTLCQNYLQENFWLAKRTRDGTKRAVDYFTGHIGNLRLDHLKYKHLESYKHFLVKTGRAKTTANMYLRAVHTVLSWAVLRGEIDANPMKGLKQYKVTRKPIRIYEDWEVQRMVRYTPSDRWKAIILVGRLTGLRRGAVLNITQDNVRGGFLYVEPKRNTRRTWEWEPKDKEIRKVPLPDNLGCLIKSLKVFYPMLTENRYNNLLKRKAMYGTLPEEIRRCPDNNFRRTFVGIQRKAFGRQIGDFHSLRKTYTTLMCEELPEHFVMRLTGHNNLKTMTYYLSARESYYEKARQIATDAIKTGRLACSSPQKRGATCSVPTGRWQT